MNEVFQNKKKTHVKNLKPFGCHRNLVYTKFFERPNLFKVGEVFILNIIREILLENFFNKNV